MAMPTGRLMESSVKVADKQSGKKKGELTCVSIKPAENGFIVTRTYSKPNKQGWNDYQNEDAVFETKETMDAFVDKVFGIKD